MRRREGLSEGFGIEFSSLFSSGDWVHQSMATFDERFI